MRRIGIDTGGTFTDFLLVEDGRITAWKVPSTPDDPARAILAGLGRVAGWKHVDLIHGSTVATNAILEGKTARIAFVTNRGFEDLIEIGRQARPDLYNLGVERAAPLAPRDLRFGIGGRLRADGSEAEPIDPGEARRLGSELAGLGVESVAICLLHSYADTAHEEAVARALEAAGLQVSVSSRLVREYREYERSSTVAVNAGVGPVVSRYLDRLGSGLGRMEGGGPRVFRVMGSNGGALSPRAAGSESVRTVLSGPAAGVRAAWWVAEATGTRNLISFDMGGTSTDVSLVQGGVRTTGHAVVAGHPVAIPTIDIHTVGAGGGSIAWRDAGGALRAGPASAGADPGPACYGRGGPCTVTDANVLLGRILPDHFLDGTMSLDPTASRAALSALGSSLGMTPEKTAEGILEVAETTMARAIRVISLHRGHDPSDFSLIAFGGAGGLHAASLAESLGIEEALVPPEAGVFSAFGMTVADVVKDRSAAVLQESAGLGDGVLERAFARVEAMVREDLASDGVSPGRIELERSIDVRYRGQSYELNLPFSEGWVDAFHAEHLRCYGYRRPERAVELVTVRVRGAGRVDPVPVPHREGDGTSEAALERRCEFGWRGRRLEGGVYIRSRLPVSAGGGGEERTVAGPALIAESGATTFVPPGWRAGVDPCGVLRMRRSGT